MSVIFLIWLVVALFLLGFWGWTSWILYRQKTSWKLFAERKKLRYRGGKLYDPPNISGALDGYKISAFTTNHAPEDARTERKLTTIEVNLHSTLPSDAAIASGGMVQVVQEIEFPHEFKPEFPGWDISYIVHSRSRDIMQSYLTHERLQALVNLMKIKNAWIVLIFVGETSLLRIDTPDPLVDAKQLNDLINQLLDAAKRLEIEDKEKKALLAQKTAEKNQSTIKIDEKTFTTPPSFELEE